MILFVDAADPNQDLNKYNLIYSKIKDLSISDCFESVNDKLYEY